MSGFATTIGRLIKIKINDKNFEEKIREIPKHVAAILASNINNAELWDSVKCMFDHKLRLYQYHNLCEINANILNGSADHLSQDEKDWRQKLG